MPVDLPKLLASELKGCLAARQAEVAAALEQRLAEGDAAPGFYRVRAQARGHGRGGLRSGWLLLASIGCACAGLARPTPAT
jgi:hypothetical protein